jgi:hypothetical protein
VLSTATTGEEGEKVRAIMARTAVARRNCIALLQSPPSPNMYKKLKIKKLPLAQPVFFANFSQTYQNWRSPPRARGAVEDLGLLLLSLRSTTAALLLAEAAAEVHKNG